MPRPVVCSSRRAAGVTKSESRELTLLTNQSQGSRQMFYLGVANPQQRAIAIYASPCAAEQR